MSSPIIPWPNLKSIMTNITELGLSRIVDKSNNHVTYPQDEIQTILMEVSDEEHDQQFTPLKVSVFVQTLLHLGEHSSLLT